MPTILMPTTDPAPHESITAEATCCGGQPDSNPAACCKRDEAAKGAGLAGCDCDHDPKLRERSTNSCCG